jgi:hypothetical protein
MSGFCRDCASWRFEENQQLQNTSEQDGFGLCERIADMMSNPTRAIARMDDEFAQFECRGEYGCTLFQGK